MAAKTSRNGVDSTGETKICKDCKIPFSDIYAYTEHLESKQHIKGVMKKKYGEKYLAAKAKLDGKKSDEESENSFEMLSADQKKVNNSVKETPKVVEKPTSNGQDCSSGDEDSDDAEVYPCELCKKVCTGEISYRLHLEGKQHKKNEKKKDLLEKMKKQKLIPKLPEEPKGDSLYDLVFPESHHISPKIDCKICKKTCVGPVAYKQHCESASHKKKIATDEILKGMAKEGLSTTKDEDEDNTPFAQCDLCSKAFSGPMPYMQHMKSPAHFKQEIRNRELGKIKDLIVNEVEDSKFKCKECRKIFSGPAPFNAHLKSSAHGKMKKKSDLMDALEKKHPELIKKLPVENSDDSEEDDNIIVGCKVCQIVFSGPESANDHFKSLKHKKALKKKAMFKKFKEQLKAGKLVSSGGSKTKKSESEDSSDFEDEFDIIQES